MATRTTHAGRKSGNKRGALSPAELQFWNELNEQGLSDWAAETAGRESLQICWPQVAKRLVKRKTGRRLFRLVGGRRKSPLRWLINEATRGEKVEKSVHKRLRVLFGNDTVDDGRRRSIARQISQYCAVGSTEVASPSETVFANLGSAYALGAVVDLFDLVEFSRLADSLIKLAAEGDAMAKDASTSPWIDQTLTVELPLVLRHQFSEIDQLVELGELATDKMSSMIDDLLDRDGWPRADCLTIFGPLLASWARSFAIVRALRLEIHPDAESQLEWAVRQFLRMLRFDRTLVFSGFENPRPASEDCRRLLLGLTKDPDDHFLADRCLRKKSGLTPAGYPEPSSLSEWGESGLLQSDWARGTPKVGFAYSNRSFAIEIGAARPLIECEAMPCVRSDGRLLAFEQEFQVVCNEHDNDLDYVELEIESTDKIVLNRQLILSRDDHFLIIADGVTGPNFSLLEYECDWSVVTGIECMAESETRELYLRDSKIKSLILPLGLPEWRTENSPGRLDQTGSGFRLSQKSNGVGLYAPLFFDLSPKRSKRKRTWRRLTVAEHMQTVPPEIAAAFRVQIGKQQWLLYRAVGSKGNRTFFGENFIGEFLFSRFDADGNVTELLRIE